MFGIKRYFPTTTPVKTGKKTAFFALFFILARVFWIGVCFFESAPKKGPGSVKHTKMTEKNGCDPTEPYRKVALYALTKNFRKKVRF